jgi:hypothetical protein
MRQTLRFGYADLKLMAWPSIPLLAGRIVIAVQWKKDVVPPLNVTTVLLWNLLGSIMTLVSGAHPSILEPRLMIRELTRLILLHP